MKILFVDDTTHAMKYYVKALRDADVIVELRSSIETALETFSASNDWDGAIIDVMFHQPEPPLVYRSDDPSGDSTGLFLLRDLRKIKPGLKVIALTNLPERPAAVTLRGMSGVSVIGKNVDPIQLAERVLSFFAV